MVEAVLGPLAVLGPVEVGLAVGLPQHRAAFGAGAAGRPRRVRDTPSVVVTVGPLLEAAVERAESDLGGPDGEVLLREAVRGGPAGAAVGVGAQVLHAELSPSTDQLILLRGECAAPTAVPVGDARGRGGRQRLVGLAETGRHGAAVDGRAAVLVVARLRLLEGVGVGEASRTVPLPGRVALSLIVPCIPPLHVEGVVVRGGSGAAGRTVAFVFGPACAEAGVGAGARAQCGRELGKVLPGKAGPHAHRALLRVAVGRDLGPVQKLPLAVEIHAGPPLAMAVVGAVQRRVAAVQVRFVGRAEPQPLPRPQALQDESVVLGLGAGRAGGLAAAAGLVWLLQHFADERGRDRVGVGVADGRLLHVHGQPLLKISRQLQVSEKREEQENTCDIHVGVSTDGAVL